MKGFKIKKPTELFELDIDTKNKEYKRDENRAKEALQRHKS